ncbi:MAG: hypothetical protein ACYC96_00110 [Fimbriimonadaceae bacterium]
MKAHFCLPLVALLAGCASKGNLTEAARTSAGGYIFAFKPKVGDTATYAMKIGASALGRPATYTGTLTMKVTDGGSGNVNLESTTQGLPGGSQTTVQTFDPTGKLVKTTLNGKPVAGVGSGASTRDMLPDHPVKVGDTWTGSRTIGNQSVTAEYHLSKVEAVGGTQLATVDITKLSLPNGKLAKPGSVVLEPATGMLHSLQLSIIQSVMGQQATEDISMEKQ